MLMMTKRHLYSFCLSVSLVLVISETNGFRFCHEFRRYSMLHQVFYYFYYSEGMQHYFGAGQPCGRRATSFQDEGYHASVKVFCLGGGRSSSSSSWKCSSSRGSSSAPWGGGAVRSRDPALLRRFTCTPTLQSRST